MRLVYCHTLEAGASKPRGKGDKIDTLVLHYTATEDLPRFYVAGKWVKILDDCLTKKVLSPETVAVLKADYGSLAYVSDALALCAIAARSPREASWHYCIPSVQRPILFSPKGTKVSPLDVEVVEFVPPSRIAHHVGPLTGATNRRSIGIEIVYPGHAPRRTGGKSTTLVQAEKWFNDRGWFGNVSGRECPDGVRRWFVDLPGYVERAVTDLCERLCLTYPIVAISSHYTFAPTKRIDPDPPLDLDQLRSELTARTGRAYRKKP